MFNLNGYYLLHVFRIGEMGEVIDLSVLVITFTNLQSAEEKVPVWYIMDEFGSRIQHSDEPTFATAPFYYIPHQLAYTILWPLRDISNGGMCS